ncbi:MAG: PASTA domain-containing protein [Candidatus Aminicenantes bacterium]|nr:PASTA domain-containing protein [Candidatus Aminicenantes bacterium]
MASSEKKSKFLFYALLYIVLFFASAVVFSQVILRGELITLPDLSGKTVEEARSLLSAKKIDVAISEKRFDSRTAKGLILAQNPSAGSRIKPGRTISVAVSQGSEQIEVPKLEGRSLEMAGQVLKSAGLRRGRVTQIHTPRAAAGRILGQEPAPGTITGRGSEVDFLVSRGEAEKRYIMPDLIAKRADAVLRRLKALEFTKLNKTEVWYPDLGPGIIIRQEPKAGSLILKRNEIRLEVSR